MHATRNSARWGSSSLPKRTSRYISVPLPEAHPRCTLATLRRRFVVAPAGGVYSGLAITQGAIAFKGPASNTRGECTETGLDHVGTLSSVRKARGHHHSGEKVPGPGAEFVAALLPVHQPRDDSVWTLLLESGMPVLSRVLPVARR